MPAPLYTAAQLQPIHALSLACSTQRALLPVAVGAMNIHAAAHLQPIHALRLRQRRPARLASSS